MCFDIICIIQDLTFNILLGMVMYHLIKRIGFSHKIARWASLIPVIYVADLITGIIAMSISTPITLILLFEIFGYIAPFFLPLILLILLKSNWPIQASTGASSQIKGGRHE